MVSDQQVKRLWRLSRQKWALAIAAAKAGMDPKTARKYLRDQCLPSEMREKHMWRTRPDPLADSWDEIRQLLAVEPGLQAKTICEHLQQAYPGRFSDGQVRTLRRRISYWRATEGPPREVFFAQKHRPGELDVLVCLARADDAAVGPARIPAPLPLFDDLRVCLVYDFAHFRERLPAPVPKFLDFLVDECRGRFHRDVPFHVQLQTLAHILAANVEMHDYRKFPNWFTTNFQIGDLSKILVQLGQSGPDQIPH